MIAYGGSLLLTMIFAAVIYAITDSMLLAGVTGAVGGLSYAHASRQA